MGRLRRFVEPRPATRLPKKNIGNGDILAFTSRE
ncbi:hypothetical protein BLA29_014534 [Euroglyphus maynei]|uniref:Uncharacterized protein n=1 Tax=Euroglyphus maynei TaxID=6958 RepID=A0A1Y3AS95_EURMA|nr:hypothetical protein BLA29_014534 [Euroglyphus maynei]